MTTTPEKSTDHHSEQMKIAVSKDGPYIVTGGIPLKTEEICNDDEGNCRTWKETKSYPLRQQYALCRCGRSKNMPFCDGTHAQVHFDGTESGNREPYIEGAEVIRGPALTLADNEHLCVHARFCMRAGGIWNLTEQSGIPEARDTAIEEACNCPSCGLLSGTGGARSWSNRSWKSPSLSSNILQRASTGHSGCGVKSLLCPPTGNPTRYGTGSPSAVAGNRTTSRSATGATYSIN